MATDAAGESNEAASPAAADLDDLRAHNAVLTEELRRLRAEYARARRAEYRRTAIGFALVGVLAVAGGLAFPGARPVLFALGGTGGFVAILTYYLTPERFIAASVGEGTYAAFAATATRVEAELGLADVRCYAPTDDPETPVRLYVPQHADYVVPDVGALESVFVLAEDERSRGVSFVPTGSALLREFETALVGELDPDPEPLADQLVDGLVEQFELAESVTWDRDAEGTQLAFGVSGSVYGSLHRFDHPVVSFLAAGLARGLETPVRVETRATDDERADAVVTCRWGDA